jgi:hypothetical protein
MLPYEIISDLGRVKYLEPNTLLRPGQSYCGTPGQYTIQFIAKDFRSYSYGLGGFWSVYGLFPDDAFRFDVSTEAGKVTLLGVDEWASGLGLIRFGPEGWGGTELEVTLQDINRGSVEKYHDLNAFEAYWVRTGLYNITLTKAPYLGVTYEGQRVSAGEILELQLPR